MAIRKAEAADLTAIRKIHDAAFGGPGEGQLVANLMAAGLDTISLVAVAGDNIAGDEIVGHILFSPLMVEVDGHAIRALALAPLGIMPANQRRGLGQSLTRSGLATARQAGWEAVIVLGSPDYYGKFGFHAALTAGFRAPFHGPAFMGLELRPGSLTGEKGRIIYPVSFGIPDNEPVRAAHS